MTFVELRKLIDPCEQIVIEILTGYNDDGRIYHGCFIGTFDNKDARTIVDIPEKAYFNDYLVGQIKIIVGCLMIVLYDHIAQQIKEAV